MGDKEDDDQSAGKDPEKTVSKRKYCRKGKPKVAEEKEKKKPKTPAPVCESKSVERLVATTEKDSGKELHIEKSRGTALKDIPNVAHNLSRKKNEETCKLLHTILFGRRGKDETRYPRVRNLRVRSSVTSKQESLQFSKVESHKLEKTVRIGVLGASGHTGSEIVRLFANHPYFDITLMTADRKAGQSIGSASQVKSNISQFSGFIWHANEDKQKNKIKEKLDKCVEEKLLELCNVLDLPIAKTTARKEDVVTELLEFFEAPQATSDELLADKEVSSKGNKRKRSSKKSTSNLGAHLQKAQLRMCSHGAPGVGAESKEATKKRKRVTEAVEEKSPIPKKSTSKDIAGKKVLKGKEKKPEGEKLKPSDTELKNATCDLLKEVDCNTATITDILKLLVKRFNTDLVPRKSTIRRIMLDEIKAKGEKLKPSETELKKELKPSDTELKNATCELLKEVDCKTATITDILKLLVKRFNTDLVPRISTIRRIIMDEMKAKGEKLKPSDAELKNATCELLKEVDCKTATIPDILKLLVKRFNTGLAPRISTIGLYADLVPRISTIRRIIMDEIKARGEKLKPSDTELKNATCELFKELKPSDTELKNATCELLKEVDCKTATITDILKLLGRLNSYLICLRPCFNLHIFFLIFAPHIYTRILPAAAGVYLVLLI